MNEKEKKVSIVIPTFNRAHYLPEAIDSCLAQTYNCEIIVCDHGSTDNTQQLMKKYKNDVNYIRREQDLGPHFCWLDGVLHAKNKFVHLQYDDDWIKPEFIEKCMYYINDKIGFVFTAAEIYDENNKKVINTIFNDKLDAGIYKTAKIEKFFLNNLVSPGAIVLRKHDIIDALYQGNLPVYEASYHGVGPDYFISLICLLRYPKIAFISEALAVFRSHKESITIDAKKDIDKQRRITNAYEEVKNYYLTIKKIKKKKWFKFFKISYWRRKNKIISFIIDKIRLLLKGNSNDRT